MLMTTRLPYGGAMVPRSSQLVRFLRWLPASLVIPPTSSLVIRCQGGVTGPDISRHQQELQAAVDVVERACRLCLSVRAGMEQGVAQLEKSDDTPVTIADFGVQALVSLELGRLFPSIPLVGEEDASQLRAEYEGKKGIQGDKKALVESVVDVISMVASAELGSVDCETVLDAIDRGAMPLSPIHDGPVGQSSYWVLDPIDGTRGFLRGGDALYVVGLALVEEGKLVLGVMGCPNLAFTCSDSVLQMANIYYNPEKYRGGGVSQRGIIMAASLGGGCWVKPIQKGASAVGQAVAQGLIRCRVDSHALVADAWFCISDHEVWSRLPLAQALATSPREERLEKQDVQLLPLCCGSLCKYFALALGGASVFILHDSGVSSLKVWDHAAGVICVVEAGGQVTDARGTALEKLIGHGRRSFKVEGGGILASNGSLHHLLLTRMCGHVSFLGQ